jgi:GNAT superfamily N-acetyltransferase
VTARATARAATVADIPEIVRLAGVMFAAMGVEAEDPGWTLDGAEIVEDRLGDDLAVFVVDHPSGSGLAASAAGTVASRLPGPLNPAGRCGYVQWVATDPELRSEGRGRAVMTALLGWFDANGVDVVELHATPYGEALYRSLGFDDRGPVALRRRRPPAGR